MNYEETLKAMVQGKKVRRMSWNGGSYICFNSAGDIVDENGCLFPLFLDWEIYEEPQKEPEMTAEHAIEVLKSVRNSYRFIPDIDEVIDFAIEAIERQNQFEPADDLNNDDESVNVERAQKKYNDVIEKLHMLLDFYKDNAFCRQKIKNVIESLERDTEPEHKCNACHCNCSHTGTDTNLQEEMKQALSRKFFELEEYSAEESYVNCMLDIYNSIFPEELSAS